MQPRSPVQGPLWGLVLAGAGWFLVPEMAGCQGQTNQRVSPDLFGELVDLVTPGYLHWSQASGDTVDPEADRQDFDNNFGEHAGKVDTPTFSNQAQA